MGAVCLAEGEVHFDHADSGLLREVAYYGTYIEHRIVEANFGVPANPRTGALHIPRQ